MLVDPRRKSRRCCVEVFLWGFFALKWSAVLTLAVAVSHSHQVATLLHRLRSYRVAFSGDDDGVISGVLVVGSS